ncbi:hypothetical protein [Mammaliicoccus sciuri]|uniref:hypothetical protein n=1 Tax=Mammaliicoccus sciuri TaxID=1296 RepID=UPI0019526F86|nr:hypothetical protein [Mammaliicoccus sciuri]MCJ0918727.1 hypothetical protein [Mammaliicoccus sciuri]MCJ0961253.1 hypothetical protein [Mammaliicoccus sciuri]
MKLIKSQFNIKTIIISVFLTLIFYYFRNIINFEDIKGAISSIITLISVNFALYGVTLSIIASIHEREVIKKLLRNGSNTKKELEQNDNKVFYSTLFSIIFFIIFQAFYTLIIGNIISLIVFILISLNSIILTIYYTQNYFKQISKALYEYSRFEKYEKQDCIIKEQRKIIEDYKEINKQHKESDKNKKEE